MTSNDACFNIGPLFFVSSRAANISVITMPHSYIRRILDARIYDLAIETPLDPAPQISTRIDNKVLIKREDLQPVFSFKIRGAYNKIRQLSEQQKKRGVITASAGNHAQGLAM